jgi:precorrin-6B methylase 2
MINKDLSRQNRLNLDSNTELCELMNQFGSDKGSGWHNYTKFYHDLFKDVRMQIETFFELGLGTNNTSIPWNMGVDGKPGASLFGWQKYFPNAQIYGADIDKDILFQTDRISTCFCDQTNPEIIRDMWKTINREFDVIMEDGMHDYSANITFFENSIDWVKKGGVYIMEDLTLESANAAVVYFQKNGWDFEWVNLKNERNPYFNSMFVIYK